MNVTLIGASGFVGTRLINVLAKEPQKYRCKNIDLLPSHFYNDLTVIGDVRDPDVVILLAAQHRDDVSPVSLYYDTNVGGMKTTLEAMEKNNCKRIIFFSSVAVYGLNKKNPDENHPADPFNHYGNGIRAIPTGTSTSSARLLFSASETEEMSTIFSNRYLQANS